MERRSAIILAAGRGQRLGMGPKAFVEYKGTSLLNRALTLFRGVGVVDIVAVLPEGAPKVPVSATYVVENPVPESGPIGSVILALNAFPTPPHAVLVSHVDHPHLDPADVETLWKQTITAGAGIARVIPTWEGQDGHPIGVTPLGIQALVQTADPSQTTLRDVLARAGTAVRFAANTAGVLFNLNTPADAQRDP